MLFIVICNTSYVLILIVTITTETCQLSITIAKRICVSTLVPPWKKWAWRKLGARVRRGGVCVCVLASRWAILGLRANIWSALTIPCQNDLTVFPPFSAHFCAFLGVYQFLRQSIWPATANHSLTPQLTYFNFEVLTRGWRYSGWT